MTTISKQKISDWHSVAKMPLEEEALTKRCSAIQELQGNTDRNFWLDIVRFYLDSSLQNTNSNLFVFTFQKYDDNFPKNKIEKLIRVLTGITLATKLNLELSQI